MYPTTSTFLTAVYATFPSQRKDPYPAIALQQSFVVVRVALVCAARA